MHVACIHCGATNRVPDDRLADRPNCGQCHQPLLPGAPAPLDDATLPAFLARTGLPVVVDFWAAWCGPCKAMAPAFASAAAQRTGVHFVKVDTDRSPESAGRFGIRSIPTLVAFQDGREVARVSGAMAAGELLRWLDGALPARAAP